MYCSMESVRHSVMPWCCCVLSICCSMLTEESANISSLVLLQLHGFGKCGCVCRHNPASLRQGQQSAMLARETPQQKESREEVQVGILVNQLFIVFMQVICLNIARGPCYSRIPGQSCCPFWASVTGGVREEAAATLTNEREYY